METDFNIRRETGRAGEDIACELLEGMGHVILERNWRSGHLEIDIISHDPAGIHFIEVKTRRQNVQAPPQANVDRVKQRRIVKAAQGFLRTGKGAAFRDYECMFDVVAVTFEGDEARVEWFSEAWIPLFV